MANRIDSLLGLLVEQGGSDLHLCSGNPPRLRLRGDLVTVKSRELGSDETLALLDELMGELARATFERDAAVDFAYEIAGRARFRVNIYRHIGGVGAVFRAIPHAIPTVDDLGLPAVLKTFTQPKKGFVLITGPTGSGKSSTVAALVDQINGSRKGHIVTIEDPIEFVHARKRCLVSQREVGVDSPSFVAALKSALREDPDVIVVGEMRDLETIALAVSAAETGVLVFGTLHTSGAVATVDRIVNAFHAEEQARIRTMLSTSLVGIASQTLVRRADGRGRLPAVEVLVNTPAISNMLREGKTDQLANAIQAGGLQGMQTLDTALRKMLDANLIGGDEAYLHSVVKSDFTRFAGYST
jgi:twitching motility protein PilT